MYNMTTLQNADTILKLITYANDSSEQILMGLLMIGIFFILLMALKRWDFDDGLVISSFVCFILSSLLTYAKLLNIIFPLAFLALAGFTAFWIYTVKRN